MALDVLCGKTAISLKKPWFKKYSIGEAVYQGCRICAVKPLTYMNSSGIVVPEALARLSLGVENLVVICDTMDLPAGSLRLKTRGSSAGHRGIKSLIAVLGTENFKRLYIGVGRPAPETDVISHVLGEPRGEEAVVLAAAVNRAAGVILSLLKTPPEDVMNEINTH
jgi:PTH1 family peptidyl-tRNA hydrolase